MISRFCLTIAVLLMSEIAAASPKVITSIAPLYEITSAVMENIDTVELLIDKGSSPHSFRLRPSSALSIQKADLLVWIGPGLENNLQRPLKRLADENKLLTILDLPLPAKLKNRQPGLDYDRVHSENGIDPHVWLDPDNACAIATAIADRLSQIDPGHARLYQNNNEKLQQSIRETDARIESLLKPVRSRKFAMMHDALQYFEKHYALRSIGALTVGTHNMHSAKRLAQLKGIITGGKTNCILYEAMPDTSIIDVLREGSAAHAVEIDPLGLNISPAEGGYPELLTRLAETIYDCLSLEH